MILAAALALAAAAPADCQALHGAHPGNVVVQRATTVQPGTDLRLTSRGSYEPTPIEFPLCRVEGTIEGNIGFELWLPSGWNGRLLGAGVGGDAGVFNYRDTTL